MSIEHKIDLLIAAIDRLNATLTPTQAEQEADKVAFGDPQDWRWSNPVPVKELVECEIVIETVVEPVIEALAETVAATYDDVKKTIVALAKVDRALAVELLAKYDATSGPKLHEDNYAAFLRDAACILS